MWEEEARIIELIILIIAVMNYASFFSFLSLSLLRFSSNVVVSLEVSIHRFGKQASKTDRREKSTTEIVKVRSKEREKMMIICDIGRRRLRMKSSDRWSLLCLNWLVVETDKKFPIKFVSCLFCGCCSLPALKNKSRRGIIGNI